MKENSLCLALIICLFCLNSSSLSQDDLVPELQRAREELELSKKQHKDQFAEATAEIVELRKQVQRISREVENKKREIEQTKHTFAQIKKCNCGLANKLLSKNDRELSILVLRHLISHGYSGYYFIDGEGMDVVRGFLESGDKDLKATAISSLQMYDRNLSIELGFQAVGKEWLPTSFGTSEEEQRIRRHLSDRVDVEYDEVPLIDILDELRDHYHLNVQIDADVNTENLISVNCRGIAMFDAVDLICEQTELKYKIDSGCLYFYPADKTSENASFTYNVRGLLTTKLTIDDLAKLAQKNAKTTNVKVLDEYRMTVTCSESKQRKISRFLASLNKSNQ